MSKEIILDRVQELESKLLELTKFDAVLYNDSPLDYYTNQKNILTNNIDIHKSIIDILESSNDIDDYLLSNIIIKGIL